MHVRLLAEFELTMLHLLLVLGPFLPIPSDPAFR